MDDNKTVKKKECRINKKITQQILLTCAHIKLFKKSTSTVIADQIMQAMIVLLTFDKFYV